MINYHALQLTAYERNGFIEIKDYMKDMIQEQMYEADFETLLEAYNKYCSVNSYEEFLDNDEETLQRYFGTLTGVIRATQYGDYNFTHDYIQFNGYGNLDSYEKWQVEEEIKEDRTFINYILDWIDEHNFIDISEFMEHQEEILQEAYKLVKQGY